LYTLLLSRTQPLTTCQPQTLATCLLSFPNFLFFWEISLARLKIDRRCDTILGLALVISTTIHANKVALAVKTWPMALSPSASIIDSIFKLRPSSNKGKGLVYLTGSIHVSLFTRGLRSSLSMATPLTWAFSILLVLSGGHCNYKLAM